MPYIMLFFPLLLAGEGPRVRVIIYEIQYIALIPDPSPIHGRREFIINTSMVFFIISKVSSKCL